MSNSSKNQKSNDLTPEFERAVKKLLATPPKPRKSKPKPAKKMSN